MAGTIGAGGSVGLCFDDRKVRAAWAANHRLLFGSGFSGSSSRFCAVRGPSVPHAAEVPNRVTRQAEEAEGGWPSDYNLCNMFFPEVGR